MHSHANIGMPERAAVEAIKLSARKNVQVLAIGQNSQRRRWL
jgi:hypothetical protein